MTTRITGMNSGIDVDALVKAAMKPYQTKVDKEVQNRKVLEYQQEQYKQIMSDASDFYDKYFDISKAGNLMLTDSYVTETFTSTPDGTKVTAKGLAGASLDNYTTNVTQLAAKASDTLLSSETGNKSMTIGTATIKFAAVSDGSLTVSNYNKAVADEKARLTAIVNPSVAEKAQLADLNANAITAKYSEFSRNVTFTASAFGGSGFTIKDVGDETKNHAKAEDKYLEATIKNSKGEVYNITSTNKQISNTVTVDNVQFNFKGVSTSTSVPVAASLGQVAEITGGEVADVTKLIELTPLPDIVGTTTKATAADGSITTVTDNGVRKTTTITAKDGTTKVTTIEGNITTVTDKYGTTTSDTATRVTTTKVGTTETTTRAKADGTTEITKKEETNGTTATTTTTKIYGAKTTIKKVVDDGKNPAVTTSTTKIDSADGSTTTVIGEDGKTTTTEFGVDTTNGNTTKKITTSSGTHLADGDPGTIKITDVATSTTTITKVGIDNSLTQTVIAPSLTHLADGDPGTTKITDVATSTTTITKVGTDGSLTKTIIIDDGTNPAITKTTVAKTTVTIATTYNTPTSLTGATDVKDLKEKIVNFVNDYNKLMTQMNAKIFETRDKDYMPLTDEQKKEMSEAQITAWEKKAQTGLLRKDDDLERITSAMKSAMSTVISGSGLSLEKIGITPVKDYTTKNGLFTIDENKLTKALEESGGDIKDLFTRAKSTTDQGGALTQLKSSLYSEFKVSSSSLSKKSGLSGSSTETDNTITKNIAKKKKLITQLNTALATRENALYKKYSALETAMEKLNSQQSSLASMLGQN